MALLNFGKTYTLVLSDRIGATSGANYIELLFTNDGHIITHGIDYTPTFSGSVRGFVPASDGVATKFLRGNGTWGNISISDLPITDTINSTISDKIPTASTIAKYIANQIIAAETMRFKGTIALEDGVFTVATSAGTSTGFPTSCQVGDSYRIAKATGLIAGQVCESGDFIMCIKSGTGDSLNDAQYWSVIQTNIKGTSVIKINGSDIVYYSPSGFSTTPTFYAPTSKGTQWDILTSSGGNDPSWSTLSLSNSQNTLYLKLKSGKTEKIFSTELSNIIAASVKNALTVGTGLSMTKDSYNGSSDSEIFLKKATSSELGGVRLGENITIDGNGILSLTYENVTDALGFVPFNPSDMPDTITYTLKNSWDTDSSFKIILEPNIGSISSVNIPIMKGATDSANGTPGLVPSPKSEDRGKYLRGDGTWVLPTVYDVVTNAVDGLAPKIGTAAAATISNLTKEWVLTSTSGNTPTWRKLPANAFNNTWREILVNGLSKLSSTTSGKIDFVQAGKTTLSYAGNKITISSSWRNITIAGESIGDKTLNFTPTGSVYVLKGDSDTNTDAYDVGFDLMWFNLDTNSYETI